MDKPAPADRRVLARATSKQASAASIEPQRRKSANQSRRDVGLLDQFAAAGAWLLLAFMVLLAFFACSSSDVVTATAVLGIVGARRDAGSEIPCRSGWHHHPTEEDADQCCNGFRLDNASMTWDDHLVFQRAYLRPVKPGEPLFPWERASRAIAPEVREVANA